MTTDPHAEAPEENPEDHIGEELPDPWDSDRAEDADWPNGVIEVRPDAGAAKGVAHVEEI